MSFQRLRLEGVTRTFGGQTALAGLDLIIERGEFITLLGPSGCGKSTALNCLAGLLPLSAGRIWLDDRRLDTLPPERRGFGMVFQNYALFPHLSVRRNVSFGLQMRRLPRAEIRRRTDEAIRLVHLSEHAGKLPGQLSGGQQQRVAIARAVVLEPDLVLMDEPLSNLDAKLRLEMRTEIRRLHQSLGLTTVYVTHDQEEALSMSDRLVVLRAGRVQQVGTPEQLHNRPANRHVADFMGFRNLLPARAGAPAGGTLGVGAPAGDTVGVEAPGLRLAGTPIGAVRAGDAVVAAARPEDLRLVGPDSGGVPATVEVVEYRGRQVAVEARTDAGLALHLLTGDRPAVGDKVEITVTPERLLVFPADPETGAGPEAGGEREAGGDREGGQPAPGDRAAAPGAGGPE